MPSIVYDFAKIARLQKALRCDTVEPEEEEQCSRCFDSGWECYGLGYADPHFRVCEECFNPNGYECP